MILGKSIFLSLISLHFAVFLMHRTRRGQRTQHNTEVHEYRKVKKEKTHTVCPLPFPSHVSSIATSPYQKANPTIHLSHGLWMRSHVINPAPCFTLSFSRVFLLFSHSHLLWIPSHLFSLSRSGCSLDIFTQFFLSSFPLGGASESAQVLSLFLFLFFSL